MVNCIKHIIIAVWFVDKACSNAKYTKRNDSMISYVLWMRVLFSICMHVCELIHFIRSKWGRRWDEEEINAFSVFMPFTWKNHLPSPPRFHILALQLQHFFSFSSEFRLLGVMTNVSLREHNNQAHH